MPVFQYYSDSASGSRKRSGSRSNGHDRAPQAGSSKQRLIEYDDNDEEDYDVQAALEVEQAENGYDDDWEPHDHLYEQEEHAFPADNSSKDRREQVKAWKRPSVNKAKASFSKSNGKQREVLTIDNDDEDDEMDMIPVPVDDAGAIVSDARLEQVSFRHIHRDGPNPYPL